MLTDLLLDSDGIWCEIADYLGIARPYQKIEIDISLILIHELYNNISNCTEITHTHTLNVRDVTVYIV